MFEFSRAVVVPSQISRFTLSHDGRELSFGETLELWSSCPEFRRFYSELLRESEFDAYRWETPGLRKGTTGQPFQFVLLNAPEFSRRRTDAATFRPYFETDQRNTGIVCFDNIGKDATLIVPSPQAPFEAYGHLAAFVRQAPKNQVDDLWSVVGETVMNKLDKQPLWLSTAGGGVAWLHVRIDQRPKYYGYSPFTSA